MAKKKTKVTKKIAQTRGKSTRSKPTRTAKKATKTTKSTKISKLNFTKKVSLVIPCYNEIKRIPLLVNGLKKFDRGWIAPYEVIVVDDGSSDGTGETVEKALTGQLDKATAVEVITLEKNQGKGNALKVGVEKATGDFILTLDADMATEPLELKKWLMTLPNRTFKSDEIYIGSREHKDSKVEGRFGRRIVGLLFNGLTQLITPIKTSDTQCGFKLYPAAIAKPLFKTMKLKGWAHDVELLYKANLEGVKVNPMPVTWKHVEDEKISVAKDGISMVFQTILTAWRIKFDYFIGTPFRELGKKATTGEASIYRFLFALLAVGLLFLMPSISSDYGITGDEHVQKVYGEYIVEHFKTDGQFKGKDNNGNPEDALTMKPNLYYYGGFFDYIAARLYRTFPSVDAYNMRHGLNAIVGFLLILFTGLLARELTGSWKMGFIALLLMAVTPRIFGHSMNNPKDIPFAAAYVFALLHIIRLVKQLPNPSFKAMAMTALGIALSISIRIGGLILVGILGLFVGIAFLWRKELRQQLTNFKLLGGLTGKLTLVVVLGYLGGLLYWPWGQQDIINNPLEALGAMSAFETGIQMLYNGEHMWSDQLPWYYIPKWFWISAPIAVLLGLVLAIGLFLYNFFYNRNSKYDLPLFMAVFAGIFPWAYATLQESPLYDGMRHFLFIYPLFAALAAYGWMQLTNLTNKAIQYGGLAILAGLVALPTLWMVNNHPYQSAYFNELFGGTKKAFAKYETDYWMQCAKPLCEWVIKNAERPKDGSKLRVAMTTQVEAAKHYFAEADTNIQAVWMRNNQRYTKDWDYGIFYTRFINEGLLRTGAWPSDEVLYTEKVDGIPVGVVVKRKETISQQANNFLKSGQIDTALILFDQALALNPKNDIAWLGKATAHEQKRDFPKMKAAIDSALTLSDTDINILLQLGKYYFNIRDFDNAIATFEKMAKLNYKQTISYYYLAVCYQNKQDNNKALKAIEQYAINDGRAPQVYDIGIRLAGAQGISYLQTYLTAKKLLTEGKAQEAYNAVNQAVGLNKNYEPAVKMKKAIEKASGM